MLLRHILLQHFCSVIKLQLLGTKDYIHNQQNGSIICSIETKDSREA